MQLLPHFLKHDEKSGHLDAAAGGACAGTAEHQEQQYHLGRLGPKRKVQSTEAGGCDKGTHGKEGMVQGIQKLAIADGQIAEGQENGGYCDDQKIDPHLLTLPCFTKFPLLYKIKYIEIHTEKNHENCDQKLAQHTVVRHTRIPNGKAAGTCRTEADAKRIKQGHTRQKVNDDGRNRHDEIDFVQSLCRIRHSGDHLADVRSG